MPKSVWAGSTAVLGAMALLLAAAAPAAADEVTIGVAMKTQLQRRWAFDAKAMQAEADRLGVKLIFQWANDNPATQASQVENLLTQGIKALLIVPVDDKAAGKIVKSAHESNVPVIAYDSGISGGRADFTVQRNSELVGQIQAEAALKFAPKGVYAVLKGDPATSVAQDIGKSYDRILNPDKNIKIVFDQFITNWDPKNALANAENILSAQNDKVDAFVVANDGMASGVAQALKGRNLGGKVYLSGLDADVSALQLVAEGVQTLTVWTDLVDEGTTAVKIAAALAEGKKPDVHAVAVNFGAGPVPTYLVKVSAVTKDNLCDFITKSAPQGWVTVKEVFPDKPAACQ